ncbi:MAG TPA: YHS domain-containing (seleno)protein [Cyclobacteriaceae bacterium]|jgi:YHS domain-containing protein|nr:YHS domain-containing (seleno)protein [Cyclobacteriaceae bacterium]
MKAITKSLLAIALFINGAITYAQVVEPIDKNKVANGGYDLVAYFTDNAAVKGNKNFTHELNGVKYQFASEEHKSLFKSNPEKYLPVCDGYCAWGVAEKGKKVPVNPETFKIIDNKLHLFFNGNFNGSPFNTLPEWNKNEQNLLTQLPVKWAALKK